ncbi:X-Pro aminopeptidase [Actibacterium mucosum KCTC 23349]|uniref:X-Pro aminopeptidase n=1 Tax=Actibacterium mucosum KCTC 23349 TaxID=1454373 RepID=A0A037ZJK3_9RHOB|nr:aminopeptidase P family protein [Actibacterium mucosum]KAJ55737.1 X-Pro aminopeptidase [Actibacterium mucosum KCTC 23349]
MFQNFDATTSPEQGPPRLAALRDGMAEAGVDGFLVPRADAHQGEYVAPCDDRLAWLTGFTGSAGFCIALADQAGLFVDGRYRLQAPAQAATEFAPVNWPEVQPAAWLRDALPAGGVVAFDPWLHSCDEIEKLEQGLAGSGITLQATHNLVDAIWDDRPGRPGQPALPYPIENAGESAADKRNRLAADLRKAGHDAAALTLPDSICWLLNLRGTDIVRNPVMQSFALLFADGRVALFADAPNLSDLAAHLGREVTCHPYDGFIDAVSAFQGRLVLDKASVPVAVMRAAQDPVLGKDPCVLAKARKNKVEIDGARAAHLRDGAAMVEFLTWLEATAPKGGLTEIDVVSQLEGYRRATNALRDVSFETIAGAGPNGAIMHYRVTRETNRDVKPGELLLVDSGGQYIDGTTDITRTVAVGDVGHDERAAYTRVLQGLIAMSRVRWPQGLAGRDLDAIARYPLWLAGQDYDHGTGHGVGAYLCVHEGPQRLSRISHVPLETGMILSNEPGYYRPGAFGIRLENLIVVSDAETPEGGDGHRQMLAFETLTFVPFDRRLILVDKLSSDERAWLDSYHATVHEKLHPRVSPDAQHWLATQTAPM